MPAFPVASVPFYRSCLQQSRGYGGELVAYIRGPGDAAMIMGSAESEAHNSGPTLFTRACLAVAALLPWFAVF